MSFIISELINLIYFPQPEPAVLSNILEEETSTQSTSSQDELEEQNLEIQVCKIFFPNINTQGLSSFYPTHSKKDATLKEICEYINVLLPNILHHRNQLKNFRMAIKVFREINNSIMIDIDFSEKLKVINKFQAQSVPWNKTSITVHSGILKWHKNL